MVKRAWLLALCAACGVDVVELAPTNGEVLLIGDVPPDAVARFASGEPKSDPKMLTLRYPAAGVVLPSNVAPIRFAWDAKPTSTYELTLQAGDRTLRVYTRGGELVLPVERWSALLQAGSLSVSLAALEDGGKRNLRTGDPQTIAIAPALTGTFYLATASDSASARISDSALTQTNDRDRALGASYGSGVARVGPSRIELADRTLDVPAGGRVAHPSWSPDGSKLVFTYWPPALQLANDPSDEHEGSQLAQLSLDGTFSALQADGAMNARRPRFSPDGSLLVFEGGKLGEPDLFAVASAGGMARRVTCGDATPMMMGGMVRSGAPAFATTWLAFVSPRPYLDPAHAQVWLAELSLDDLHCTAPFWFPAQDAQRDYVSLWYE